MKSFLSKIALALAIVIVLQPIMPAYAGIALSAIDEDIINNNLNTAYMQIPPLLLKSQSYTSTKISGGSDYLIYVTAEAHPDVTAVNIGAGAAIRQPGKNAWQRVFKVSTTAAIDVTTVLKAGSRAVSATTFKIDPTKSRGTDTNVKADSLSAQSPIKLTEILASANTSLFQNILAQYPSELDNIQLVTASAIEGNVGFNPLTQTLSGTTAGMEYSVNAASGISVMGDWKSCIGGSTPVAGYTEGKNIIVRDKGINKQWVAVSTALQNKAPTLNSSFALDYSTEKLENKSVTETLEYKFSSMGSYQELATEASIDISSKIPSTMYVRIKASTTTTASKDTPVVLPARPMAPSYGINYAAGTTDAPVLPTVEFRYGTDAWQSASGDKVSLLTAGAITSTAFRIKAVAGKAFASGQTVLTSAGGTGVKPLMAVNYSLEKIEVPQYLRGNLEMSGTLSTWTTVTDDIALIPGSKQKSLYLRYKGQTNYQEVIIPARPAMPSITISYLTGETSQVISKAMEYSIDDSTYLAGQDQKLILEAGKAYAFRMKGTDKTFVSDMGKIGPLSKMSMPAYILNKFDYASGLTAQSFTDAYEYVIDETGGHPDFTAAKTCSGQIPVEPGKSIFIRVKSDGAKLPSDYAAIDALGRRDTEQLASDLMNNVDYENSSVKVTTYDFESSADPKFASGVTSYKAGDSCSIEAGKTIYIRYKATAIDFASLPVKFTAATRPKLGSVPTVGKTMVGEGASYAFLCDDLSLIFSMDQHMSDAQLVSALPETVNLGNIYYFQRPADANGYFASEIVSVEVK